MPEVTIRVGGEADIDRLEPLWNAMFAHHATVGPDSFEYRPPGDAWRRRRSRYAEWILRPESRLLLAETPDGRAVGYAFATVGGEQATVVTGRVGELESLCVLPEHRGQGIGEALVEEVLRHFRSLGLVNWSLGVMEGNDRARAFYERLGLRPYVQMMLGRIPPP